MWTLFALAALAADPVTAPTYDVSVRGASFASWEGRPVQAVLVDGAGAVLGRARATVQGGAFTFAWTRAVPTEWRLAWWVDVDGDGACTRADAAHLHVPDDTFADIELELDPARAAADKNPYACDVAGS